MSYGDIFSVISALFSLIGLLFVGVSLQQTRRSINAATYQNILQREADDWNNVKQGSIAVRARALQNFGVRVTEKDYSVDMDILLDRISLFNFYEGIFFLHRQGALNKEVWENWQRSLVHIMSNRDIRAQWEIVKHVYNPIFTMYVARIAPIRTKKPIAVMKTNRKI